jgi:four helix bundle protein
MQFKFERLEVWQHAIEFVDKAYSMAQDLPAAEDFNLKSQLRRASTSIALNIAEGSTSQTSAEQARFLGLSIRSLIECIACSRLIGRRGYVKQTSALEAFDAAAEVLLAKLIAFRRAISPEKNWVRESETAYEATNGLTGDGT